MAKLKISKKELKKNIPVLMLWFFGFYIMETVRLYIDGIVTVPHIMLGVIGVIFTLFFFKVE